jgi:hypothetical protein
MIERDVIRAENRAIFLGDESNKRDDAIAAFCGVVGDVKSRLKEFQECVTGTYA